MAVLWKKGLHISHSLCHLILVFSCQKISSLTRVYPKTTFACSSRFIRSSGIPWSLILCFLKSRLVFSWHTWSWTIPKTFLFQNFSSYLSNLSFWLKICIGEPKIGLLQTFFNNNGTINVGDPYLKKLIEKHAWAFEYECQTTGESDQTSTLLRWRKRWCWR